MSARNFICLRTDNERAIRIRMIKIVSACHRRLSVFGFPVANEMSPMRTKLNLFDAALKTISQGTDEFR